MKLPNAYRKSKTGPQNWNKHIDGFHQKLANKRIRRDGKQVVEEERQFSKA